MKWLLFFCLSAQATILPEDPDERRCVHRRMWNYVCGPLCGVEEYGKYTSRGGKKQACVEVCGGETYDPEALETNLALWRAVISDDCIEEMREGWRPTRMLIERVKRMLDRLDVLP